MKKALAIIFFFLISISGFSQNIDSLQKYIQKSIETAVYLRSKTVIQKSSFIFVEIEQGAKVGIIFDKSDTILKEYSSLISDELIKPDMIRNYKGLKLIVPVLFLSPKEDKYRIEENFIAVFFESLFKNASPVILTKRIVLSFSNVVK